MNPYIDLHTHSTFSDGLLNPVSLVDLASRRGLAAIALTDHDTISGLPEAFAQGHKTGVEILSGIEVSADLGQLNLHILGYGFNQEHSNFLEFISKLQRARDERNEGIIQRLANVGIVIEREYLLSIAGSQIGRPHFASLLVRLGHAVDQQDAFHRFLKKGSPTFVEQNKPSAEETIRKINEAGGLAVLAHPGTTDPNLESLPDTISTLKDYGLSGLEVYYPAHNKKRQSYLNSLAKKYDLLPTGGTDFHGNGHSTPLGGNSRTLRVPLNLLNDIKIKLRLHQPVLPGCS